MTEVHLLRRGSIGRAWSSPGSPNEARLSGGALDRGYFMDFSADADYGGPFDAGGVPMIDYTGEVGARYNPWYICHYALACYERYSRSRDSRWLERFNTQVELLRRTGAEEGEGIVWWYEFPWMDRLMPPWASGLAQSFAISVLLRSHLEYGADDDLTLARRALVPMRTPVTEGGLLGYHEGLPVVEEVVTTPLWHILNGSIFALLGVHELHEVTGDQETAAFRDALVESVASRLHHYDLGRWSRYALNEGALGIPNLASVHYHGVHVSQLAVLMTLFPDVPEFAHYHARWTPAASNPLVRPFISGAKAIYKLLR